MIQREIAAMRKEDGAIITDKESIAEVFFTFYEELYRERGKERELLTVVSFQNPDVHLIL